MIADDPTGLVSGSPSLHQQQFGGYYNIHRVTNTTALSNLKQTTVANPAGSISGGKYPKYKLELKQTDDSGGVTIQTINFVIGFSPPNSVMIPTSVGATQPLPDISCNSLPSTTGLFGIQMPNSDLPFTIQNYTVNNLSTQWTYEDTDDLLTFSLYYRNTASTSSAPDGIIIAGGENGVNPAAIVNNGLKAYKNSLVASQTEDYEPKGDNVESFNDASNIFKSSSGYPFSRNGMEGTGVNSQFYFHVLIKNNIFAEDTNGSFC